MSLATTLTGLIPPAVRPFFLLSHLTTVSDRTDQSFLLSHFYSPGWDDALFLIGWGTLLTLARVVVMGALKSFARSWLAANAQSKREARIRSDHGVLSGALKEVNGVASAIAVNGHANGNGSGNGHANGGAKLRASALPRGAISSSSSQVDEDEIEQLRRSQARRAARAEIKELANRERVATRFAEQGFACTYYILMWSYGLWIHWSLSLNPLNTDQFWEKFPYTPLPGAIKIYYLIALAFYGTQIAIINIEERRKDHLQMFAHHIVTVALIVGSYLTHITAVGVAILFILDFCDIFLPLAKMFKYLAIPVLPDITFVVFLLAWLVTRQIMFPIIVWAVTFDMYRSIPIKWDPANDLYITYRGHMFFYVSLWILQALLCLWFYMACRVAVNVILGKPAEDTRSDGEDDDEETSSRSSSTSRPPTKE